MLQSLILSFLFVLTASASPSQDAQIYLEKIKYESQTNLRMEIVSRSFLDLPYGDGGPLGEGSQGRYDQDPLYRFDTFDCTTLVETVVSLALSRDAAEFEMIMNKIRYENGEVDYLKRNHFPSLQWIPFNVQNGLLKEINNQILPQREQKLAEAVINLPGWLKKIKLEEIKVPMATNEERLDLLEELRSLAMNYSPLTARLNYLPIESLLKTPSLLKKIPHGAIINFVRPNWDLTETIGTHMNVSHQGLIFQFRNGTYLRHASNSGTKKVMDILLVDYLKKFENHPTLKGVHLMEVVP
jgi:hypothetical protein